MPASKPVALYLQRHTRSRQILVNGGAGWRDPTLLASEIVNADPAHLCRQVTDALTSQDGRETMDAPEWRSAWLRTDRRARATVMSQLTEMDELFEGKVFAELAGLLPPGSLLFVGNSMPVRDLDTFFPGSNVLLRFLSNRGASGIDGVVSSALGARAAGSGPLVLVIGDLSFYHDLNGLLAAKLHGLEATIVLLNNDGGGIFSFLPQAEHREHFETLFGTPHGLDFRPAVEMYGGRFERVDGWPAFRAALQSVGEGGLRVVEVPTDRTRNVELHREIFAAVSVALEPQRVG
jgi:2-succinyl-5-enolpyruvyl-6-hydroxy-3-cyclohexene-1-carboxylate synthase